ncbi:MAG: hypothetical protein ACJ747_11315 [Gaiellaceae bacterium]
MKHRARLLAGDGRRFRPRLAVLIPALAAVAIALTPAGSASPPSSGIKQYTACLAQAATPTTCNTSALPGGSLVPLTLTLTNANTSTQSVGSANVDGPLDSSGKVVFPINLDASKGPLPTFVSGSGTFGTNSSGELKLRNLNVPVGSKLTVSFSVSTPCTGSGTWKVPAKQSNDFLGNGNDFSLVQSGGLASSIGSGNCKLVWLYPPNNANKSAVVTNTAYTPAIGGNVHAVTVEAVGSDGVTPIDLNTGTASASVTHGTFDCGASCGTFTGLTSTTFQHGVATFPSLSSAFTGAGFMLQGSATGLQSTADSDPFAISIDGKPCDPTASCSLSNEMLGGRNDSRLDVSASSGLTFLAVNSATYDPTSHPCGTNFVHVAGTTGFEELHGGVPTGLKVTYYVNQNSINATYGKNVGAQYIPICAGTFKVVNGVIAPCANFDDTTDTTGWPADQLDSSGRFTGVVVHAICRPDGRYWGIVPSFQDKTDPAGGPRTASWGSATIDGAGYRFFTMTVPPDWDYKGGV